MANPNCWGPLCNFTGTRDKSDANPGRCTKTGGYVAFAEIMEILKSGDKLQTFHDKDSDTDVMIYKGSSYPDHFIFVRYLHLPLTMMLLM